MKIYFDSTWDFWLLRRGDSWILLLCRLVNKYVHTYPPIYIYLCTIIIWLHFTLTIKQVVTWRGGVWVMLWPSSLRDSFPHTKQGHKTDAKGAPRVASNMAHRIHDSCSTGYITFITKDICTAYMAWAAFSSFFSF